MFVRIVGNRQLPNIEICSLKRRAFWPVHISFEDACRKRCLHVGTKGGKETSKNNININNKDLKAMAANLIAMESNPKAAKITFPHRWQIGRSISHPLDEQLVWKRSSQTLPGTSGLGETIFLI